MIKAQIGVATAVFDNDVRANCVAGCRNSAKLMGIPVMVRFDVCRLREAEDRLDEGMAG